MTKDELNALNPGDIIRHKSDWKALVVTGSFGERITAVRTYDITNPTEWDILYKHTHEKC